MSMRSAIARAAVIGAAASLVAISAPAGAAENQSKQAQASVAASGAAEPKATKEKTYCITSEITGTRLAPKVCKTRKEWLAQGVDPLSD